MEIPCSEREGERGSDGGDKKEEKNKVRVESRSFLRRTAFPPNGKLKGQVPEAASERRRASSGAPALRTVTVPFAPCAKTCEGVQNIVIKQSVKNDQYIYFIVTCQSIAQDLADKG